MLGSVFGGKWRIERPLSEGGMGAVYVARHIDTGAPAALKVMLSESARNIDFVHRFRREIQSLASIRHPNVVTFMDSGVEGDSLFLVMEMLDGQPLSELATPVPWQRAIAIGADVCRGLMALHHSGLVHRDLKPQNVFLQRSLGHADFAKLIDLGIVRYADRAATYATAAGMVVGTLDYLSPEQLQGQPADRPVDLYALGIILYQLISGRHPFRSDDFSASIAARFAPIPPVRAWVAGVPRSVDDVVLSLLRVSPHERPTAHSLLAALDPGLHTETPPVDRSVQVPPVPTLAAPSPSPSTAPTPQPLRVVHKRRSLAGVAAATVGFFSVAAGVAIGVSAWPENTAQMARPTPPATQTTQSPTTPPPTPAEPPQTPAATSTPPTAPLKSPASRESSKAGKRAPTAAERDARQAELIKSIDAVRKDLVQCGGDTRGRAVALRADRSGAVSATIVPMAGVESKVDACFLACVGRLRLKTSLVDGATFETKVVLGTLTPPPPKL